MESLPLIEKLFLEWERRRYSGEGLREQYQDASSS
jgi:hypothetical protein